MSQLTNYLSNPLFKAILHQVYPIIIIFILLMLFVLPAFELLFIQLFYNNKIVLLKKCLYEYDSNDTILNESTPIKYENILGFYIIPLIITYLLHFLIVYISHFIHK